MNTVGQTLLAVLFLLACGSSMAVGAPVERPGSSAANNNSAHGGENPVMKPGRPNPDRRLGAFKQNQSFDCFFLASIIALANDPDGRSLVESGIRPIERTGNWQITFANEENVPVAVSQRELTEYRLTDARRNRVARPVAGDPDVQLLEIAADKLWKKQSVKPEGLWDDVPMNALAMFSNAPQRLIWNRNRASAIAVRDIDKFKRLPTETIQERQVTSSAAAEARLLEISDIDSDGLSMVMLDYKKYHAVAIIEIDWKKRLYTYIDPAVGSSTVFAGKLDSLLKGMADGTYAIDYLDVPATETPKTANRQ